MVLKKEISSTEKLLDTIRSKEPLEDTQEQSTSRQSSAGEKVLFIKNVFTPARGMSIGIDVGPGHLRLIKIVRSSSDSEWNLIDHRIVPLRVDAPKGTPEFASFVKLELDKFCNKTGKFTLWANMSSSRVEVSSIRIPKVEKKQIENAVYWTAKKTLSFDEKASIFDFEIKGETIESGVSKLIAMVYVAPKKDIEEIKDLFESIGYPLDGLTIAPFSVENLFRTECLLSFDQTVATLYIGRTWSRIDIFSKGHLVMTRGIRAGINSMIEGLRDGYNEEIKQMLAKEGAAEQAASATLEEGLLMQPEEARGLLYSLSPDSAPSEELEARFGLDKDSILRIIKPVLVRLVRQIDITFRHYMASLGNESVSIIYVSSVIGMYRPIVDQIGDSLGIEKEVMDPLDPRNPHVKDLTAGVSLSDRISYALALGVALSDSVTTPNFLFTYRDKERKSKVALGNRLILISLVVVLALCIGVLFMLGHIAEKKRTSLAGLEQQLKKGIQVDEKVIPLFIAKVQHDREYIKKYGERYLGIAAISELSALSPSNIRLLQVGIRMKEVTDKDREKGSGTISIEGIVSGNTSALEDPLVEYVLKLQSSPMFGQAKITKSTIESFKNVEMLRFTLNVRFS